MASEGEFDVGTLSASQQAALQQYTDVTGQEVKDAVPLLERSQWNVQVSAPITIPSPEAQAVPRLTFPDRHRQVL